MQSEAAIEAVLPASERSKTIQVITRVVANENGEMKEVEKIDSVLVRPLPFRRWPVAIGHITNLLQYLPQEGIDLDDDNQVMVWLGSVINVAFDDVFAVLELATDKQIDFFDKIDLDDGIKIAVAVVEVNKDFFEQNVTALISQYLPAVTETLGQMQ